MRYADRDQIGEELRRRLPGCHVGVGRPGEDRLTVRLGDARIEVAGDAVIVRDAEEVVARQGIGRVNRPDWRERLTDRLVALAEKHLGAVPDPEP